MNWRNAVLTVLLFQCIDSPAGTPLFAVEFPVPAGVQGTEEAECSIAPDFAGNAQKPAIFAAINSLVGNEGTVTLLRTSTEEVLERRASGIDGLWRQADEFKTASCVSKCIRLPEGAKLSRLSFTDEDGRNECLRKPIAMGRMPTISDLSCGNTVWRDIVLVELVGNEQLLCATAVAWMTLPKDPKKPGMPATQNRLLLEYSPGP